MNLQIGIDLAMATFLGAMREPELMQGLIETFESPSEHFGVVKGQLYIEDSHPPCSLRVSRLSEGADCLRNMYCLVLSDLLTNVFKYS